MAGLSLSEAGPNGRLGWLSRFPLLTGVSVRTQLEVSGTGAHVILKVVVVRALVAATLGVTVIHWA